MGIPPKASLSIEEAAQKGVNIGEVIHKGAVVVFGRIDVCNLKFRR